MMTTKNVASTTPRLLPNAKMKWMRCASPPTTTTRRKSSTRIDLLGRRVVMSADVFGGNENECYNGVVVRKTKYKQAGKTKNGYDVKWHDGDVDFW